MKLNEVIFSCNMGQGIIDRQEVKQLEFVDADQEGYTDDDDDVIL